MASRFNARDYEKKGMKQCKGNYIEEKGPELDIFEKIERDVCMNTIEWIILRKTILKNAANTVWIKALDEVGFLKKKVSR